MTRPNDTMRIEQVGGEQLDLFTTASVTNDLMQPSECAIEFGNDDTFAAIESKIAMGAEYKAYVNDQLRLTGRIEHQDIPQDAPGGASVRLTIRTKLADAMFASAPENVRVKDVSIKEFVLALYAPLDYAEDDFIWAPATARDLLTGRDSQGKGSPVSTALEPIKAQEARVRPPESIYEGVDRHLRRHGLIHWDSPDGRIVVGAPNDTQPPIYHFLSARGTRGRANNVLGITRTQDWSDIPSLVAVFGIGAGRGTARARAAGAAVDEDVTAAGFYRPVITIAEGLRTNALADAAARRELSARSKRKDALEIETDGLSYWDGQALIPYGVDTVCDIDSDQHGGNLGAYYIYRTVFRRSASEGDTTNLCSLRKGIWRLS